MKLDVDIKSIKVIPKSVLKIGVKLPEVVIGKVGPEREAEEEEEEAPRPTSTRIANNVFKPRLERFGGPGRSRWREPALPHPIEAEVGHEKEKEKVRRELAAVFKLAKSTEDLQDIQRHGDDASLVISPQKVLVRTGKDARVSSMLDEAKICAADGDIVRIRGWVSNPTAVARSRSSSTSSTMRRGGPAASFAAADAPLCRRCGQRVFPLERVEPVRGHVYHPQCFRCYRCQAKLGLATFVAADVGGEKRLFCRAHKPKMDKVMLCAFSPLRARFPAFDYR